jgi:NADH-quinone oxidoreductase subunit F
MTRLGSYSDLLALQEKLRSAVNPDLPVIIMADATCCRASGSGALREALEEAVAAKAKGRVQLRYTGCHGFCQIEPNVLVTGSNALYANVKPADAEAIIESALSGEVVERLVFHDPDKKAFATPDQVPFYKKQLRYLTGMNQEVDPLKIEDYFAAGGYSALAKALSSMEPDQIIDEVKTANLRGRGGGGFPAGIKWASVRKAAGSPKYVVCNADEGDPGAYMDRSLLEGNPHLVIEGMLIGAFAIGSEQGYVYVRNEYPMAVQNLTVALEQAREHGLVGKDILGSGFNFDIQINRGGGAFVCGESSALMNSIEGKVGEPIPKYVHMSDRGLYDKPTNLNNVETWANVPFIINKGSDWYSSIGTKGSKGTKIFSLVGKIVNTGLVEVPMGTTLREIVEEIGGGIPKGRKFKAIQTGGPSGGCIPAEHLDMPVDFDELYKVGSMMGSGGMIVMDEDTCMVDVARYFTNFLVDESCGKCTPCREGVSQLRDILVDICEGRGREGDLELLESMSQAIMDSSLCALGQTAPNPLLTTLRFFRDEYEAHINDKKCPARVCRELLTFDIHAENCTGCGLCKKQCPSEAITGKKKELHALDPEKCIRCGACFEVCKFDAVIKE